MPRRSRIVVLLWMLASSAPAVFAQIAEALSVQSIAIQTDGSSARFWLTCFTEDKFSIRVIDNAGPGDTARYKTMDVPLRAGGAFAGANGGFFNRTPFEPVGLMISEGRRIGRFDPDSWMKGIFVVRGTRLALESAETFKTDETDISGAIQSGPWLVRGGRAETDNSRGRPTARTFIGHDGKGRWFLGVSSDCSLHHLAGFLRSKEVLAVVDVQWALNLDGGPSTGIWVRGAQHDFYRQEKSTVRNYLAVVPLPPAKEFSRKAESTDQVDPAAP
jgi:uncharacterized protein YigE (DUF2233 family)